MKYSWLLFDADETLFDFSRSAANALERTLLQAGLPWESGYTLLYKQVNDQVWQEFERGELNQQELRSKRFVLFLAAARLQADPLVISPLYLQNLARGTELVEDAEQVVRALLRHYRLALVTNGLADVQRPRLEHSRLRDCFEQVFISEEMGAAKPSAAFFERVFQAIGQPARERVLIIGDSLSSDMRGGLDYGMDTCWFNPTGKNTELAVSYQIRKLGELIPLLQAGA